MVQHKCRRIPYSCKTLIIYCAVTPTCQCHHTLNINLQWHFPKQHLYSPRMKCHFLCKHHTRRTTKLDKVIIKNRVPGQEGWLINGRNQCMSLCHRTRDRHLVSSDPMVLADSPNLKIGKFDQLGLYICLSHYRHHKDRNLSQMVCCHTHSRYHYLRRTHRKRLFF